MWIVLFFYTGEVFQAYDYGLKGNLMRYGSIKPMKYDLGKVTAPVRFTIRQYLQISHYEINVGILGVYLLGRK